MSVLNEKRNVFTTISSYTSLINDNNKKNKNDSFQSVNNKGDILSFFIDIIRCVVGRDGLKNLVGEIFVNLIRTINPIIISGLKKQFIDYNASDPIPNEFINDGYFVEIKKIDAFGLYKIDPTSSLGVLLYGNNPNTFDRKVYSAIANEGVEITYGNIKMIYDSLLDGLIIKPFGVDSVGNFNNDYLDNFNVIDENTFIPKVLNNVFGTLNNEAKKTSKEIENELKIDKTIDLLIESENPTTISITEYEIDNIVNGVESYDIGCGVYYNQITLDNINNVILDVVGNDNPISVGNVFDKLPVENSVIENINENTETIKDNFLSKILKAIISVIVKIITVSPQIRLLFFLQGRFTNSDIFTLNFVNDMLKNKIIIGCIIKLVKEIIFKFIYEYVLKLLLNIIKPVTKKIIKERFVNYVNVLKSLI